MNEVNFEYYEMQIGDLWNFEKPKFLVDGDHNMDFMIHFQKKVRNIIIKHGTPFLTFKDNPTAYNKNVKLIQQATDLKDSIRLPFFVEKDNFYYYDQDIIISKENKDFDYYFILKLMQYDLGLKYIDRFLDYQFEKSFDSNIDDFFEYLTILLRQYSYLDDLSEEVYLTTDEYIDSLLQLIIESDRDEKLVSRKTRKRPRVNVTINSFTLSKLSTDINYFEGNQRQVYLVLYELMKHKFIHESTKESQFKNIFTNKEITKSKKIKWIGGYIYLKLFMRHIVDNKKIDPLGNDIWVTAAKCFTSENASEFEIKKLRTARGGTDAKIKILYSILENL